MTCIVGIKRDGVVTIGGDSAGVGGGYALTVRADEKVFTRQDVHGQTWAFGFTSSFRMGNLIRWNLALPHEKPGSDGLHAFMVKQFIPNLRACLKDGGFMENDKGSETGGTFLVGYQGELFVIFGDLQVAVPSAPYAAVGAGFEIALGAMYATPEGISARDCATRALAAAETFCAAVRGPFVIEESEGQREIINTKIRPEVTA